MEQAPARGRLRAFLDWWFRDRRTGRVVIVHVPNLPIVLWLGTLVARQLVDAGSTADWLLQWASSVALGWWALDELVRGVNPWRRSLGLAAAVAVAVGVYGRLA